MTRSRRDIPTLERRSARRLALARAGLLQPKWVGLSRSPKVGQRLTNREFVHRIIDHFGYLQLDTVSIAGARSHAIVVLSRFPSARPELVESLLEPNAPLFEYWGHEASWIPLELYPHFEFRRERFKRHPWWGNIVGAHPKEAKRLLDWIEREGPLHASELERTTGEKHRSPGWWNHSLAKRLAAALWSSGELSIRGRTRFLRTYDIRERVIPERYLAQRIDREDAFDTLVLKALDGHGWATTGTIAATWRLKSTEGIVQASLARLREAGEVVPVRVRLDRTIDAWIRPRDLDLVDRLARLRPRPDRGVLLSPFDPVLWDRKRVRQLFDFEQVLEIYKPEPQRKYGYYCLPILAGDRLIGRVDLKAHRTASGSGRLEILALHYGGEGEVRSPSAADREAARSAIERFAKQLRLSADRV